MLATAAEGRRARWGLGSLLMSVYDKETDTFPTVTRVASGLSTTRDCTGRIVGQQNVRVDFTAWALHTFKREEDSEGNPNGFVPDRRRTFPCLDCVMGGQPRAR